VNAGNNFNNGDFERSRLGAPNTQWGAYFTPSASIVRKQGYEYLGRDNTEWDLVGPRDDNKVLRLSAGVAGVSELITGLTPNTDYVFRFRAKGNGATVNVKAFWNAITAPTMQDGSGNPASVAIAPPDSSNVWRDYSIAFRTNASGDGSTSVALFIGHTGPAFVLPVTYRPCALFHPGEACFDDVGLCKASDVS
jgi:hypothetical protein